MPAIGFLFLQVQIIILEKLCILFNIRAFANYCSLYVKSLERF